MKTLLTLLLLLPIVALSQSTSLYNADGTLKADPQFKITKEALQKAPGIEKELLATVYNGVKYPAMAKENNFGGTVIVKLAAVNGRVNFEVVKYSEEVFKYAVNKFFSSMPQWQLRSKVGKQGDVVFYLPIKFQIIEKRFKATLSANKMLTIEAVEHAPDTIRTDDAVKIN